MYSDVWKQLKEEKKIRLVRKLTFHFTLCRYRTACPELELEAYDVCCALLESIQNS